MLGWMEYAGPHAPLVLGCRPTFNALRGLEVDLDAASMPLVLKPLTCAATGTSTTAT